MLTLPSSFLIHFEHVHDFEAWQQILAWMSKSQKMCFTREDAKRHHFESENAWKHVDKLPSNSAHPNKYSGPNEIDHTQTTMRPLVVSKWAGFQSIRISQRNWVAFLAIFQTKLQEYSLQWNATTVPAGGLGFLSRASEQMFREIPRPLFCKEVPYWLVVEMPFPIISLSIEFSNSQNGIKSKKYMKAPTSLDCQTKRSSFVETIPQQPPNPNSTDHPKRRQSELWKGWRLEASNSFSIYNTPPNPWNSNLLRAFLLWSTARDTPAPTSSSLIKRPVAKERTFSENLRRQTQVLAGAKEIPLRLHFAPPIQMFWCDFEGSNPENSGGTWRLPKPMNHSI